MSHKKLYLYPAWIRLWHLVNALCFLVLVVSGLSMHFGTADGNHLIRFDIAVGLHNVAAIMLTIGFVMFIVGNMITRNGRYYRQWRKNMGTNLMKQARFYAIGIFKGEHHPFPVTVKRKFNPLQKFAYVLAMYFGMPLLIISGISLLFPETIAYTVFGVSGLFLTDLLHIVMGYILTLFLLVHIYTCTLGEKPGTLFKGMIKGYHDMAE